MRARTGPALPQSLLEEISGQADDSHRRRQKGGRQLSRKEARKQEREGRKQRKAQSYASHGAQKPLPPKRSADHEHPDSPQRKKAKLAQPASNAAVSHVSVKSIKTYKPTKAPGGPKSVPDRETPLERASRRAESTLKSAKARPIASATPVVPRSHQEEEDDAYIAYLESKLGYRKGGQRTTKYGKGGDDGLDDLFQDLDTIETSIFSSSKTRHHEETVSEENVSSSEDEADSDVEDDFPSQVEDEAGVDEEWGGISEDAGSDAENDDVSQPASSRDSPPPESALPSAPTPAGRYVPPALRNRSQGEDAVQSEAQMKLQRQLKGLLNRLSEQNIASIVDGVEEIYRNQRRHDVTSTLTSLIVDGISSHSMLLDSYVVLHAAFVSALHKLVGIEFAAYFVQSTVASYEQHFAEAQPAEGASPAAEAETGGEADGRGKEASNLIVLLSELYNFQVVSCVLVYDVIRGLLEGALTEFKVELLLKITRNSGQQLRQDDPTALKSIIQIVHSKLPSQANAMSSRARFMVETLTNLKNNKVKKPANGGGAGAETVDRLKKFLSGLSKKRHVLSHEPLRVGLDDLHNAERKGKWWLVGAAWGGDPLAERQEAKGGKAGVDAEAAGEDALVRLARKQGMNTEIRRGVFVVLMSSEDYVDACERLAQLKLTEVQQRELIRVILHCCGNEKTYNPYYTLVGQQLCRSAHAHRITLQFCLWDFLRDLGETAVGGAEVVKNLGGADAGFDVRSVSQARLRNVARAYGWWVAKDCCTLAILKPVDFTVLKPQSHAFLKELLLQVFISTQVSTPLLSAAPSALPTTRNRGAIEEVFIKATRVQNLAVGLVYFLGEAFRTGAGDEKGFIRWASQVAMDTLRTGMDVVAGL